jgi:hypothetical protein
MNLKSEAAQARIGLLRRGKVSEDLNGTVIEYKIHMLELWEQCGNSKLLSVVRGGES